MDTAFNQSFTATATVDGLESSDTSDGFSTSDVIDIHVNGFAYANHNATYVKNVSIAPNRISSVVGTAEGDYSGALPPGPE